MSALNICNGAIGAGFRSCYPRNRAKTATFPPSSATNSPRQRCLRQSLRFRYMAEMLRRHCSQPLSFSPHCMESSKTTLVLMDNGDISEDRLHNDISYLHTGPSESPKENEVLLSDICSGFKFTVLMGLLFFQGSQAANAGTELAAVQPLSFIGDLGDISTGLYIVKIKRIITYTKVLDQCSGSLAQAFYNGSLELLETALSFKTCLKQLALHIVPIELKMLHQLRDHPNDSSVTLTFHSVQAFLLIFFSELGDKTFFIAALLAARNSGAIVFLGTFGALSAMSVVSVVLGRAFHYVDGIVPFRLGDADFPVDDFAAVCLLVYFGVTTLLEAASSEDQKIKEEQEEAELAISDFSGDGAGIMAAASTALSTFLLVFVAEWGDKSFFSTIALAAASSPLGVIGGALAGHALATLLAVVGGSLLGTFLSEKVIAYVGGSLFLVFAAVTLVEIVN